MASKVVIQKVYILVYTKKAPYERLKFMEGLSSCCYNKCIEEWIYGLKNPHLFCGFSGKSAL
jgi:hypothetical protein